MAQWFDSQPAEKMKEEMAAPRERRWRGLIFQGYVVAAVAVFAVLAALARGVAYFPIDLQITLAMQSLREPWLAALMVGASWPGFFPQAALILVGLSLGLNRVGLRSEAVFTLISGSGALLLNLAVKALVARPRPDDTLVEVVQQLSHYSFPSGHVMFYTALFGFLLFLVYTLVKRSGPRRALEAFFLGLVILVGPSRIYLGGHWASDVLGAYLLGSLWLAVVVILYRRRKHTAHTED